MSSVVDPPTTTATTGSDIADNAALIDVTGTAGPSTTLGIPEPKATDDGARQQVKPDHVVELGAMRSCLDSLASYLERFDKINGQFVRYGPDSSFDFLPDDYDGGPPPGSWSGINQLEKEVVHFHHLVNQECGDLADLFHVNLMHQTLLDQIPKQRTRCLDAALTHTGRELCTEGQLSR